jgi:hypothetical protein
MLEVDDSPPFQAAGLAPSGSIDKSEKRWISRQKPRYFDASIECDRGVGVLEKAPLQGIISVAIFVFL